MKKLVLVVMLLVFTGVAQANMKCVKRPSDLAPQASGQQQDNMTLQMYQDKQNPVMDLMACANMTDFQSVKEVFSECGCWEAVKKLCKFDPKKFAIKAVGGASVAQCLPFAPWN